MDIQALLAAVKDGSINGEETARQIRAKFFTDLGHTVLDTDRARRTGSA
ncbi:MAG: 1-(5-phosphoribosyl)-5-amino-4-imidazole-carboxylate carboxylase, partial [Proteobacteria bacterium]|nr:1-(5-phosphoribosyl)-5-amino-4-imidazole-carboxylate carboxylase [Pseudomonadota bacterium]